MTSAVVTDRRSPMTRALAWSLALHALAVVVAALPSVRGALAAWQQAAEARAVATVPAVVPVEIEVMVPELTVVRPPPPPAESFIRTDGLPEAAPDPEKRQFISDRNTRAASSLPPDPTATEAQPTQDGVDIPVVEIIRRDQSDGEDETLPPSDVTAAAAVAESRPPEPAASEASAEEPVPPAEVEAASPSPDASSATAAVEISESPALEAEPVPAPVEERLALIRESEIGVRVDPERPKPAEAQPPRPPRPVLRDPELASRPPPPPTPPSPPAASTPPAGFSGMRAPTRLRGTITNQGPSSVDAEDTPTGRYMKQVTGAIEKEWHRKRRMNRDFVTFGTIKLEFFVDARGYVHDLSIKNRSGANAIMQDFTLNAVLDAKIPPMPAGLTEVLDRERLLISYDIIVY